MEAGPGFEHLLVGGRLPQLDRDALGVAVDYGDAVAVGTEGEAGGRDARGIGECAKELSDFFLQLLFFVLDEGDDVAEDVERGDAG